MESTEISWSFLRYVAGADKKNHDMNLKKYVWAVSGCIDWLRKRRAPFSPCKFKNRCSSENKFNQGLQRVHLEWDYQMCS